MDQDTQPSLDLSALKQSIAAEIRPLIPQLKDPIDRFDALVTLLREKWDANLANEAFEAAKTISDPDEKVRSLQYLMSEIGYYEREAQDRGQTL